jgi:hypothetical protein
MYMPYKKRGSPSTPLKVMMEASPGAPLFTFLRGGSFVLLSFMLAE